MRITVQVGALAVAAALMVTGCSGGGGTSGSGSVTSETPDSTALPTSSDDIIQDDTQFISEEEQTVYGEALLQASEEVALKRCPVSDESYDYFAPSGLEGEAKEVTLTCSPSGNTFLFMFDPSTYETSDVVPTEAGDVDASRALYETAEGLWAELCPLSDTTWAYRTPHFGVKRNTEVTLTCKPSGETHRFMFDSASYEFEVLD